MKEGRFYSLEEVLGMEYPWPGVGIDSHSFGHLPHHERLRQLALGYARSAKSLCTELGEKPERLDWPRASVILFCFYHAVELFLKACILRRSPSEKLGYHSVPRLMDRYHDFYPCDQFFAIQNSFGVDVRAIAEAVGGPGAIDIEDFEERQDQVFRYLSDKDGRGPKGTWSFGPGCWLRQIEAFEDDTDRIWGNIAEAYGT